MTHTLSAVAEASGLRLEGDGALAVARLSHPASAGPDDLAVAMDAAHAALLAKGRARAAVLAEGMDWRALGLDGALFVRRARYALSGLTGAFAAPPAPPAGVHPTAVVAPDAEIAPDAAIGPLCVIGAGARIGAGAALVAQVFVGDRAQVGSGALLHPGVRIGHDVRLGARAIIQSNAVIGGDGFSFVTPERGAVESAKQTGAVAEDARNVTLARIHSLGAVTVGDDVEIGAGATIDRGTLADTVIGEGTKIDNLVQIGHNVRIGRSCLICGHVGVAGSTIIGDRVVLGGQVGIADHVTIGDDAVLAARSGVGSNVPAGAVMLGAPALKRDEAMRMMLAMRRLPRVIEDVRALKKRLSRDPSTD